MKVEFEDNVTIGNKYGPAMKITDEAEAVTYFEACVSHTLRVRAKDGDPVTRSKAEDIEKQNLGYYAGYYDNETRERVERLFMCAHPVFGSIEKFGPMSADAALKSGMDRAST